MTDGASTSFEDDVIADMRAHGGAVTAGPLTGHPLLIMTSKGAKTGEPRRAILTISRDGGDFIVAATAGGAPTNPAWIANVAANSDVDVETQGRTFKATASIVDEADRARLWDRHVAALPWFADYPNQTGRVIPIVRIRPLG